jgi:hypothetical protein
MRLRTNSDFSPAIDTMLIIIREMQCFVRAVTDFLSAFIRISGFKNLKKYSDYGGYFYMFCSKYETDPS